MIVEVLPDSLAALDDLFDSVTASFVDLFAGYDDEQLATLLDFLRRSSALARAATAAPPA